MQFVKTITTRECVQVNSIYCLGANYQSGYQYEAESDLPDGYMRNLFDGSLRDSLFALYRC